MLDTSSVHADVPVRAVLRRMLHIARAAHPGWTPRELWGTVSLFFRQLAHLQGFRRWHQDGNSPLQEMLSWRPSIVSAVRRPYMSSGWDARRRLAAIEQHYLHLNGQARPLRIEPGAMLRLAEIESRGETVEVMLDSPAWFVHEGELSLNLFHRGERIYTLVFSLGFDAKKPVAFIGAIQGLGSEQALEIYRVLTHSFHGLRPREMLMAAFRMVCAEVGIQRVLAVSDQQRVSANPYFGSTPKVLSSYDAVWSEHLGKPRPDGFYELPVDVPRRTQESIPSRKRSEYRKRYDMLDRLEAALSAAMHARTRQ